MINNIKFADNRLEVTITDDYEYCIQDTPSLIINPKNSRDCLIKFLVIDSDNTSEENEMFENMVCKLYDDERIALSSDKFYKIYYHKFEFGEAPLYTVSFEIIFQKYYINIRINSIRRNSKQQNRRCKKDDRDN